MRTIGPVIVATIGPALLALALILGACTKVTTPTSAPSATAAPAPAASPTLIAKVTPAPAAKETPATFFLEIVTPKDESVVQEASVLVQGRTVPDAVVSVNGQAVEVDATGNFSTRVTLQTGPNSIEVIASDFRGNQQSRVISLVYT